MIKELNKATFNLAKSASNPIPGRYLYFDSTDYYAIKVDYFGNKTTFKTHYKKLALKWLKR